MLMFLLSAGTLFSAMSSRCKAISLILLALNFLQDLGELIRALFSLHIIIDNNNGCLAAGTYTTTFFQRNVSIRRRLTQFDVEHLLGFFNQLRDACHITGCPQAKLDCIFAARLGLKKGIECDYPMYLTERDIQALSDIPLHTRGDVTNFP